MTVALMEEQEEPTKAERKRLELLENARRSMALLYVMRWRRYSGSQHVMSQVDKDAELKRLIAKKREWAKDGKMPIPPDREDPDAARVLVAALGDVESLDPTPPEAYLTVELAINWWRFPHRQALLGWANQPWGFFRDCRHQTVTKRECFGFLVFLSQALALVRIRHEDL